MLICRWSFSVSAAYPNPFNPSTHLTVDIPENGQLKANVYNLNGKMITELFNDNVHEGLYDITWDAYSNSSGVYFYGSTLMESLKRKK